MNKKQFVMSLGFLLAVFSFESESAQIDIKNKASLQRGAKFFMNYCSGCHSLKYLHYNQLGTDLGLTEKNGQIDRGLIANLIFTSAKIYDPIQIAMPATDAKNWFGVVPKDLSLIARERGAVWVYHYLKGFYPDTRRPFGANNFLLANTAMPNVLYPLASMSPKELDGLLNDLISFLVYVAEPAKLIRYQMGVKVLLFLAVFCIVAYLLKRIYWKKVRITKRSEH